MLFSSFRLACSSATGVCQINYIHLIEDEMDIIIIIIIIIIIGLYTFLSRHKAVVTLEPTYYVHIKYFLRNVAIKIKNRSTSGPDLEGPGGPGPRPPPTRGLPPNRFNFISRK